MHFAKHVIILLMAVLSYQTTKAQIAETSEIFITLKKQDSLIFEDGFNNCHIGKFENILSKDMEFYHDTGGMQNKDEFFEAFNRNICSGSGPKPIRKLVANTLKVFPLKNNGVLYGAIQNGDHEFYLKKEGEELIKTGFARFTHLWLLEDGEWILKRALSYDHKGLN